MKRLEKGKDGERERGGQANLDDQVYGQSFSLCSQSEWGDLLRTWQRYDRPRLFGHFGLLTEGQYDIHQTSEQLGSQEVQFTWVSLSVRVQKRNIGTVHVSSRTESYPYLSLEDAMTN